MRERQLHCVPRPVYALLVCALIIQLGWHALQPPPSAEPQDLPAAPDMPVLNLISLGEPEVLGKLLMLWLQAFDYQPGVSIPFADLDYPRVIDWLSRILDLDPTGQYPLLAASRLYGEVSVPDKQRLMLDFVLKEFSRDPARRWPWVAHAVFIAKHRLKDQELALRYAQALARYPDEAAIPSWARQMQIFVLEDMGELESAKVLLGGLLESGKISDPHERRFLSQRLAKLETRIARSLVH